jgi:glycosyltransferase involved in cell wall biosynthesis
MVPVEAMASERPVIAYGRGGAIETISRGLTGVFFEQQTVEDISSAVRSLSEIEIDPEKIAAHARQFGRDHFSRKCAHISMVFWLKKARVDLLRRSRETLALASLPGTPISQLFQAIEGPPNRLIFGLY